MKETVVDKITREIEEALPKLQRKFGNIPHIYTEEIEEIDDIQAFAKAHGLVFAPNGLEFIDKRIECPN